jgi:hypothetical protein
MPGRKIGKHSPAGGGISGDNGGTTDLIHWQNSGTDGHSGILN